MTTLSHNKVKARKQHKCCYCGFIIDINEIYYRDSIINDDKLYTWKSHLDCQHLAEKLDWFDEDGLDANGFYDSVEETFYDTHSSSIRDIIFKNPLVNPKVYIKEYKITFYDMLQCLIKENL